MKLSALLEALDIQWPGDADPEIRQVTRDSREVVEDAVFVAIVGANTDGHDFVGGLDCGVAFVERPVDASIPTVVVPDTKSVLARIASILHGDPGSELKVVGVTGTNGKTTVTTLAEQAFAHLHIPCGRIGTTGHSVGGEALPSRFTTPEAPILQSLLAQMREGGAEVALLEVSSIGLEQRRVDALPFHVGVFTNFSRDHLDFHGTMEAYGAAKAMLFERLRAPGGRPRALLCADDPAWSTMHPPEDHWTYGFTAADLQITQSKLGSEGMELELSTPLGRARIHSSLVGRHNALNLVAALGICLCCGVSLKEAAEAVGAAEGAPGRLECVPNDRGILVLVDYAHSDDALATVIPVVSELVSGRTWVLVGAGGDRDVGKRPRMGAVAERLADGVVLTSDNPRSEDPEQILAQIRAGMTEDPEAVIVDRAEAIEWVIRNARAGDAVLIAGKGHETTQDIGGVKRAFDDRLVARAALEAL